VDKENVQMKAPITHRNLLRFLGALVAAAALILALGAGSARAFGIENVDGEAITEGGEAATQAGSHPYEVIQEFDVNHHVEGGLETPDGSFKDIQVDLPAGFVGNPQAVPACRLSTFLEGFLAVGGSNCPPSTAVGTTVLRGNEVPYLPFPTLVYNLEPGPEEPARFGIRVLSATIILDASVRAGGDYGLTVTIPDVSQALPIVGSELRFWGVPGDPSHDPVRGGIPLGSPIEAPFQGPVRPFLSNPTSCGGPLLTSLRMNSWKEPGNYQEASFLSHNSLDEPVGIEGCERLPISPSLETQADPGKADSPAALDVNLRVPQNEAPEGLASALVKKAVFTLPQGVSVNTSAAAGLEGCSEAQFGLHANEPPHCPDASKIGTAKITTPLLEEPLQGVLFLAQQNANPFGSLLAAYLVAEGHGVIWKQAAKLDLNQITGQITASFDSFPQLPFSDVELTFFGGPRAVLQLANGCGTYQSSYSLSPTSGNPPATGTASFDVNQGCSTGGFNPSFAAGSTNPVGGAYAPFVLNVGRDEGEQNVAALGASLPKGESAKLAGVPLCPEANAATASCPAASRIGQVNVAVGAGPQPLWVPQPGKAPAAAYLAGPYKGQPYSLIFKVPVQAGPLDLGTVAVRASIQIDPVTAQVSVTSDPLPRMLHGIPLGFRQIHVGIDRPGFMLNPTNCGEQAVASMIVSNRGAAVTPASRFQVGDCAGLPFKPRLSLRLSGGLARNGHPALRAVLRTHSDEAGLAGASFALPPGELLDTRHIRALCGRKLAAERCPRASRLGYARLWSPLLDRPLRGPIYLREPSRGLPDLLADLRAEGVRILLHGETAAPGGRLRVRFRSLPDVPLSRAVFTLAGGRRGIVVNSEALCAGTRRARVAVRAHNGKRRRLRPRLRLRGAC
jgi:hypothetical protein